MGAQHRSLPLVRGTLDLLVLKALAWGPLHGLQVSEWLEAHGGDHLELLDSAMYQALYRLEARRLIEAEWGTSDANRRARYYAITPAGRAHLAAETARWNRYAATVTGILGLPEPA